MSAQWTYLDSARVPNRMVCIALLTPVVGVTAPGVPRDSNGTRGSYHESGPPAESGQLRAP
jgi:hypothetical protein